MTGSALRYALEEYPCEPHGHHLYTGVLQKKITYLCYSQSVLRVL